MVVYEIVLELGTWISKPKRFEMSTASNMATQFNPVHAQTSKKIHYVTFTKSRYDSNRAACRKTFGCNSTWRRVVKILGNLRA